ncbi:hypothetical protein C8R46DRAFT_300543 [Mycena filopes]|nr:hypothetical protein C8R46DRAFT_300543 [Mycena filopes]
MTGKRKRQALHSEVDEYTSLLRALGSNNDGPDVLTRLSQTWGNLKRLDASLPLGSAQPQPVVVDEPPAEELPPEDDDEEEEQPKKKQKKKKERKKKKAEYQDTERAAWTRWPLLAAEIPATEFTLDQELEALIRQCLLKHPRTDDDNLTPEDDADSPSYLPHITESVSTLLSSVLALLAFHTTERAASMQNRMNPIGWHGVLDMVAACGVVDASEVRNVKARMEATYGAYDAPVVSRLETRDVGRSRVAAALDNDEDLLFTFARPSKEKRQRPKYATVEDIDSDDLDS